jgi:hypothetical protein
MNSKMDIAVIEHHTTTANLRFNKFNVLAIVGEEITSKRLWASV